MQDTATPNDSIEAGVIDPDDVSFNPDAVLAAWEATEGVVPEVAAPVASAFATRDGDYLNLAPKDGRHSDRDTVFFGEGTQKVLVEEKAVGVVDVDAVVPGRCHKVGLYHDDDRALYVNPAQIFVR